MSTTRPLRSSYPSSHLLGGMPYRSSAHTDVAATFARVRWQQEHERKAREQREAHERDPAAANDDAEST